MKSAPRSPPTNVDSFRHLTVDSHICHHAGPHLCRPVGLRTDVRHFGTRRFGPDVNVAVSSPAARGHRWTQKGCGMAVPAEATVPVGADARRFPRVGGWAGWGRIETPADVARLLSAANHAGTPRAGTEQMARLVDTATSVMPRNLDATRVLPVAAELADLLPWPGLVRGAAIAAVGSGSLLLTLLGGAVRDGGWAAVVGLPELGAAAAPEYAVELSRLALVPAPGPDWPTVVAALIDGLDLVAVATPAEMAPGMARVLMARARQRGCVLVTTRPWPGCDLILEAVEHRWRGLGHGRGRLRVHEVRLTACGRGAMVRPTTTCVELPLSSPDRRLILRTCLGSTGVTGSGPTGSSQERHREKGSAAQGWGQIQLPDGGVGPKEVGALVPEQVAKNKRFDTDTVDEVIDVLDACYRDRRPGSGLPVMSRTTRALTVRWFAGTGHEECLHVLPDGQGRYMLGPHVWPWILSGEDIPGQDPTALRGGTPPILEWVTAAGFAAALPDLADQPLPLVCAALAVLHPGRPAVIAPADAVAGHVWLPAPGHALMLTPQARHPDADGPGHGGAAAPAGRVLDRRPAGAGGHHRAGHLGLQGHRQRPRAAGSRPHRPPDPTPCPRRPLNRNRHAQP